jgi:membrane protease YdiL (CAAX protease family)
MELKNKAAGEPDPATRKLWRRAVVIVIVFGIIFLTILLGMVYLLLAALSLSPDSASRSPRLLLALFTVFAVGAAAPTGLILLARERLRNGEYTAARRSSRWAVRAIFLPFILLLILLFKISVPADQTADQGPSAEQRFRTSDSPLAETTAAEEPTPRPGTGETGSTGEIFSDGAGAE